MKGSRAAALFVASLFSSACGHVMAGASLPNDVNAGQHALQPFHSMPELRKALVPVVKARRAAHAKALAEWREQCRAWAKSDVNLGASCTSATPSTEMVTVAAGVTAESITNNQHAGVDEGGLVKRHGEFLVVLRRGRLFTIAIGGNRLDPVDAADAFGPDARAVEPVGTWYDELLVWQDTAIVIGFSQARGGTEIGLFDLAPTGALHHRATYHLRSDDYYSGSNYASRLIGDRLVLFTSVRLPHDAAPDAWLPVMRRWHAGVAPEPFRPIAAIDRVYQPAVRLGAEPAVHAMISCDLGAPTLVCEATVILGDDLEVYYASPAAAYAWTTQWGSDGPRHSILYRLPYDGSAVSALRVSGTPPNQLAFLEDDDGYLNVIVRRPDAGVALLRLPIASFSNGRTDAPQAAYRTIAPDLGPGVIARFVGAYVLVSRQSWQSDEPPPRVLVVCARDGARTFSLTLGHDVQRIESMGEHAVVVGAADGGLTMSAVRLGARPAVAGGLTQADAHQSEFRSHGFFYREDGTDTGVFGVPIVTAHPGVGDGRPEAVAGVLFVRNIDLAFAPEGRLDASPDISMEDRCRASCVDWYGEARPIFVDDRVFALIGYEIIEGRLAGGRTEEVRRVSFTPR